LEERKISDNERPLIFCVIQGGEYIDLRKRCVEGLNQVAKEVGRDWDGYGFGARHIDNEGNFMEEVLRATAEFIPEDSLRFALGIGTPEDIVRCFKLGWDMFDCVIPTREGRHGKLFIRKDDFELMSDEKNKFYETININNSKFQKDFLSVDENCDCELCQNYTRAYLNHLFKSKDPLGMKLASIHNLRFYAKLMKTLQEISLNH